MKTATKLVTTSILSVITLMGVSQTYPIVDTDVSDCYDNNSIISVPIVGQAFYGQDANYNGNQPSYTDNLDGTVTDNVTGLMWEQDMGSKISYDAAFTKAASSNLGGYTDWRVPTIKELYSLAQFTGKCFGEDAVWKFIDTNYFNQPIGNTAIGEREIDAQTWSSTQYVGLIMNGDSAVFGYNFVDGRLKGYPKYSPQNGSPNVMYFRMVRGNTSYGINNYADNGNGTVTDNATGLMWQQADDGIARDWENSLAYAEGLTLGGYSDWRLPNAKELHSILDYSRSPLSSNSPAIDPLFSCSSYNNPVGDANYANYWTSSPLQDGPSPYTDAVYICFGEAQGQMSFPPNNVPTIYDTHGAGAQRNDPKEEGNNTYPNYHGPQGDIQYVNNYIRVVRDNVIMSINETERFELNVYPNPAKNQVVVASDNNLATVSIINALGEEIINEVVTGQNTMINTTNLSNGIYFVKAFSTEWRCFHSKTGNLKVIFKPINL